MGYFTTNLRSIIPINESGDFEANELTLRIGEEQEKFKIYTTIEKPSHEDNSRKVKEK